MRTGVLADSVGESIFAPHAQDFHDTHLAKPHLKKHKMALKKPRSDRYTPHVRPRAPYMALHEYAQILSPLNPQPFVQAFGDRLQAAAAHAPNFGQVLTSYNTANPSYSIEKGMKPETAYFLQTLNNMGYQVLPADFYSTQSGNPSKAKMKQSLAKLYEELHSSNEFVLADLEKAYNQTVDLISPPIPRDMSVGMSSSGSSSLAPTPPQSLQSTPESPLARRTRSRTASRAQSPIQEE